jgi:hypothetical protein
MRKHSPLRVMILPLLLSTLSPAAPVAYTDEAAFLEAASTAGLDLRHEGFEDESQWGTARSSIVDGNHTAPTISAQGLIWNSNNGSSEITTGQGAALTGNWGVYSLPHGSYTLPEPGSDCNNPGECGDGLRCTAETGQLLALGGWIQTNTPPASLGMFIGVYPENPIDFGENCDPSGEQCDDLSAISTTPAFFGVIDVTGFDRVEFRELEGKSEEMKFIFADDFFFAGTEITPEIKDAWVIN